MNEKIKNAKWYRKIWLVLLAAGPGIFCIGYTVGTGSITTMATSGSWFGMDLWWELVLACIFFGVMMEVSGRYGVVTNSSTIYSFRTQMGRVGPFIAIITVIGVVAGQWASYTGIIALSSNGIHEIILLYFSTLPINHYLAVLIISIIILGIMYSLLFVGKYSFFEKVLVFFVSLMGLAFIVSMFVTIPQSTMDAKEIFSGLIPTIPDVRPAVLEKIKGANVFVHLAAFVGTTMAAPTFVVRPLLMKGKGWADKKSLSEERRDVWISMVLLFVVNSAIMITTAMVMKGSEPIEKVLQMVEPLQPVLGKYALSLFMVGLISAGLSSTFPIMMVASLLVADYKTGELDTSSRRFRILAAVACLFGLIVPVLGFQPIFAQLITQIFNVFILPLVVAGFIYLVNRKDLMGDQKPGPLLNTGLIAALIFSLIIAGVGVQAFLQTIQQIS